VTVVLITGGNGQVGQELARAVWPDGFDVHVKTRRELDITSPSEFAAALKELRPTFVVNAAAYTAVDQAEDDAEKAFAVNRDALEHLCSMTEEAGATLIHLSTDYVFDGEKVGWYVETDRTNPTGIYGASKAAGERVALTYSHTIVLRTAWVYGALGPNFVRTMLRLASERSELGVVDDQRGTPTSAASIASTIVSIIEQDAIKTGLFHVAAPDDCSWWDLAQEAITNAGLGEGVRIKKLTTAEYPTQAARPANSRLNSTKLADVYGVTLPSWREALAEVLAELATAEGTMK
jgi:dTDP-4-dehydrorhamnose reductase